MDDSITVAQALRHARHDFLNELHLIQMKLDLGRKQEVQSIIRSYAEAAVQLNRLAALKMPASENWLLTAEWRHPEFHFHLECTADKGVAGKDAAFAGWLEQFIKHAKLQMDGMQVVSCSILLEEQPTGFNINIELDGHFPALTLPEVPGLLARKRVAADRTSITVSAQMEG